MKQICAPTIVAIVVFSGLSALGQDSGAGAPADSPAATASEQAPPEVEQALRARVDEYYQSCIDQKYRQAEAVLAEESRDFFYNHEKPHYKAFEIRSIQWSDNFTKALVTVRLTVDMHLEGVVIPGHPDSEDKWRLIDGQWYLHLTDEHDGIRLPYGMIAPPVQDTPTTASTDQPKPDMSKFSPENMRKRATQILTGVTADQKVVVFDSLKPGEAVVHLMNGTPAVTSLTLQKIHAPGLSVALDKRKLSPTEQAQVTLRWKPKDQLAKASIIVHVLVSPSGQDVPIQVSFSWTPPAAGSASLSRP